MNRKNNILVIKLGALGDFIQALGPMAAIRRHHPKAHITLLTTKPFEDFGKKCGYFDEVQFDMRPKKLNIAKWLRLRKRLISGNYIRVYDLQNNDRTNLYLWLFPKVKRPEWVGSAIGASHRNNSVQRTSGHAYEGHVQTLAMAGVNNISIDDLSWIKEDVSVFAIKKPYVLIVAGSSAQHPHKRWPAEFYADIARKLDDMEYQPVLLGTNAESAVTTKIKSLCPQALDLTGQTTLFQIAALARDAAAAIGNDTGPIHMIAPTGCPTLALFSKTSNPSKHTPKGPIVKVLQSSNLADLPQEVVIESLLSLLNATNCTSAQPQNAQSSQS